MHLETVKFKRRNVLNEDFIICDTIQEIKEINKCSNDTASRALKMNGYQCVIKQTNGKFRERWEKQCH